MIKRIRSVIVKTILYFFIISISLVVVFKFVPVPFTPLMITRLFESQNNFTLDHSWKSLDKISENLQKAVIASEDQAFFTHNGFDVKAIEKAYKNNQKGKRVLGGSTISQQTAKNVFLWQGRSYVRKGLEAYFTVLIEIVWGKERIMEVYLNSIEMGNGIYGAEAAAQHWYSKSAENLTKKQAAGIAAILPRPLKFKASNSSSYINKRKNKIVRVMNHVKLAY